MQGLSRANVKLRCTALQGPKTLGAVLTQQSLAGHPHHLRGLERKPVDMSFIVQQSDVQAYLEWKRTRERVCVYVVFIT